jgi:hypothetical protein
VLTKTKQKQGPTIDYISEVERCPSGLYREDPKRNNDQDVEP